MRKLTLTNARVILPETQVDASVVVADGLIDRIGDVATEGETIDLLSLPDLVRAKKTQRDKDWPMIRRLVEQSYYSTTVELSAQFAGFWIAELRSPELLIEAVERFPAAAEQSPRPAVQAALRGDRAAIEGQTRS